MIARIWRGTIRPGDREAYTAYVEQTGMANYRETPGNLGAHILTRDLGDAVAFVTLSFWESMDAIKGFAGDNPEIARYYPEDDRWLLSRPEHVEHYEVHEPSDR